MDIFTEIKTRIEPMTLQELEALASMTNVPETTLRKIKYGETTDPRIGTLQPLIDHFGICNCTEVSL